MAMPMQLWREHPEAFRSRCFALLMGSSAAFGVLAAMLEQAWPFALLVLVPAYVLWVVSDLHARRVFGWPRLAQFVVSLFPFWGLLIYLVWTRRLVGILQWVVFLAAIYVPAGLAGATTYGIVQFARGEPW